MLRSVAIALIAVLGIVGLTAVASDTSSGREVGLPHLALATAPTSIPTTTSTTTTTLTTTTTPPEPASDSTFASTPDPLSQFEPAFNSIRDHRLIPSLEVSAAVWVDGYGLAGSFDGDRELFPASNQKLFTAAGAYEILHPEHRFITEVLAADGHLYLRAGGDPSLTSAQLANAAGLTAGSVAVVEGDIVLDVSHFGADRMAPGWQDWQMPTYVGPLSAFMVDDNRWTKDPNFLQRPDRVNASRFASQLRAAGVRFDGEVRLGSIPTGAVRVASIESPTVDQLVREMMLSSDNQIAEALIREGSAVNGTGGSTAAGTELIRDVLAEGGLSPGGQDADGSGLSRGNLRSANQWVELLVWAQDRPWFDRFYEALPVAGRSGTLGGRLTNTATAGNVRAKTGTIIGGRALSGYLTLASGERAAFSIVVNGDSSHLALGLIDDFVRHLAATDLR